LKIIGSKGQRNGLLYLLAVVLSVGVGWQGHAWYHTHSDTQRCVRGIPQKGFRFTSPLLDVELPEGMSIRNEPIPFKYKIKSYVEHLENNKRVKHVAVYYRDLSEGPWFGIDAEREFDAASMMKVPVMIAWLKRAEKNPKVLQRVFFYDGKLDMSAWQSIKPSQTLSTVVGYQVEELLHFMINYSDNNATKILYDDLSADEISDVLDNMDVTTNPYDYTNLVSLHGYSGFFRILYNAAYLNREMSEKALQLLALQDFPQGIAAGVPQGVPVAAKFGEHVSGNNGVEKQLHEFGIIYHPRGPYILGIMTEGDNFDRQAEVIRTISAMVYAEVGKGIVRDAKR